MKIWVKTGEHEREIERLEEDNERLQEYNEHLRDECIHTAPHVLIMALSSPRSRRTGL